MSQTGASFAPLGGKSFGRSLATVGRTPGRWSQCLSAKLKREILPECEVPAYVVRRELGPEQQPEHSAGSWRMRRLRIRHAYVLDPVYSRNLVVQHIAGEGLFHLLGNLEVERLAGLNGRKIMSHEWLESWSTCLLLLVAIQSLAAAADKGPLRNRSR